LAWQVNFLCSKLVNDPEGSAGKDHEGRNEDLRTVELTSREVSLLLKYGYPFRGEEQKLRASKAIEGVHRVRLGAYWIELMLADLARSEREIRSRRLLEELDELYSVLESALNSGGGTGVPYASLSL
jgi:hypothetical protein